MTAPKRYYKVIAALVLVVVVSLTIFSLNFKSPGKAGFFKKIVLEMAAPLNYAVNLAFSSIGGAWKRYVMLVGLEKENRELNARVVSLTRDVNDYREISLEYARLKKLMNIKGGSGFPTVVARVVGRNRLSVFRTVLIDKGTADGIEPGFPVITAEGVAGKIMEVSWNASKVLLLVDYNSNIDALVQRNRCQGVLRGRGGSWCELKYVQRSEDVEEGDVVISSGLAGVFPKGLVLGKVAAVDKKEAGLFQRIRVSPAVDITRLEEALVILKRTGEDG
ncbi:MAG: rod shape-determining protein MreC [Deltaproteobacteria bacterium]|nr:rod shape-determining protein MreC [Deltaproteobacteria bacterium]